MKRIIADQDKSEIEVSDITVDDTIVIETKGKIIGVGLHKNTIWTFRFTDGVVYSEGNLSDFMKKAESGYQFYVL